MKKTTSMLVAFLLVTSAILILIQPTQAQTNMQDGGAIQLPADTTPDFQVKTTAYLSFRPNPVGVGQPVLVNIWLTPATAVTRYHTTFKVSITNPDGEMNIVGPMDSYSGDSTAWFEFVPDKAGIWKLKFDFGGGFFPAGNYTTIGRQGVGSRVESFPGSCYYMPSSTEEQTLIVQEDMVSSWPESPLPNDYWTRPVQPHNRDWWSILGNYPWYGPGGGEGWPADTNIYWSSQYAFTPWVQGPNTAHITFKQQGAISGLIGPIAIGDQVITEGWTSGGGNPSIVYAGRCYQSLTKVIDGTTQNVWQCFDLRTGEVYWERTNVSTPTIIEYKEGGGDTPGAIQIRGQDVTLLYLGGGRLKKYNPYTGAQTLDVSISPLTTGTYYKNGYALSVQNLGGNKGYRLINWTTLGTSTNFTERIMSNITWPWSNLPATTDFNVGISAYASGVTPPEMYALYGTNVQAASLATGALLWNVTVDDTRYSTTCAVADHGKIAVLMMGGYYLAWDLNSGKLAWKSEGSAYPWSEPGFGAYAIQSAYGMLFREAYDGVYAYNWTDGKLVWKYVAPANPYETPYIDETGQTVYSFNSGGKIADGKLYVSNSEHSESQPRTRGWRLHCINITTGEGIWNITGYMNPGGIADGYLTASNTYDGYMYIFGKGKSATTVTSPDIAVPLGSSVVIKGTVLDQSPAQPNTPCVSKDSMTTQMEYLHMQMQIAGLWNNETITGVPVSLDAVDPNGNSIHIGDIVTDGYSGTFGFTWEPEISGQYTLSATFAGDDSYGSSFATTYVSVVEAPEASPTSTAINIDSINSSLSTLIIGGVVAIIIAIAIVAVLLLKKRP